MVCPEHGPTSKNVDIAPKKLTSEKVGSHISPMKNLKNDPSSDAMREIRKMRFQGAGYSDGKNRLVP